MYEMVFLIRKQLTFYFEVEIDSGYYRIHYSVG